MEDWIYHIVLGINFFTFIIFWFDQVSLIYNWKRRRELNLILLLWASGIIGGWLAMFVFRHKIRNRAFIIKAAIPTGFWVIYYFLYIVS